MNVRKYTYIKFYKFRRCLLGKTLAEDFTSLLFVVGLDFLLYSGIVFLTDGLTGYNLLPDHNLCIHLFFSVEALFFGWFITIPCVKRELLSV